MAMSEETLMICPITSFRVLTVAAQSLERLLAFAVKTTIYKEFRSREAARVAVNDNLWTASPWRVFVGDLYG